MTAPSDLYVHESGDTGAPAVVFLHGSGASGLMWRDHMARLTGFHCLAPDLPGFGGSNDLPPASRNRTADLVAGLIDKRVPARRAHVVALSWGGGVAHTLLDRHPAIVDRAVIDGAGVLTSAAGWLVLAGIAMVTPFLHTRPITALFGNIVGMDEVGRAQLRAASRSAWLRSWVEGFKSGVSRIEVAATCPTLLVAGEKEGAIRPSNAALAAVMPHAVAMFAPGIRHAWLAREPDLHVRMVEAWLTGQALPSELQPEPPAPAAVERLRRELEGQSA